MWLSEVLWDFTVDNIKESTIYCEYGGWKKNNGRMKEG